MPISNEDRSWLDKQKQKAQTPAPQSQQPAAAAEEEPNRLLEFGRGAARGLTDTAIGGYKLAQRITDPTYSARQALGAAGLHVPSLSDLAYRYIPQVKSATDAVTNFSNLPENASAFETAGKITGEVAPMFIPGMGAEMAGGKVASKAPQLAEEVLPLFKRGVDKAEEWATRAGGRVGEYGPWTGRAAESTFELGPKVASEGAEGVVSKKNMSDEEARRAAELLRASGRRAPRTTGQKLGDIAAHEGPFMLAHQLHLPIWMAFTLARLLGVARHGNMGELANMARSVATPQRAAVGGAILERHMPGQNDDSEVEGYRRK